MPPSARLGIVACLGLASASCSTSTPAVLAWTADAAFADLGAPSPDGARDARGDDVTDATDVPPEASAPDDVPAPPDVAPDAPADVAADVPVAPPADAGRPPAWAVRLGGSGADIADDIALDAAGNVFVTGRFGAPTGGPSNDDLFLTSLGPDGRERWTRRFGGSANDAGRGVAVDRSGNVYLTGYFGETVDFGGGPLASAGGLDLVVASFTGEGAHRWSRRVGGRYGDHGTGVATDVDGNVYLSALITDAADFGGGAIAPPRAASPGLVVASYSSEGAHRWSRAMGGRYTSVTARIASAPAGDVLLAGTFNYALDLGGGLLEGHAGTDGFVARLGPDGTHRWSQNYGGGTSIAFAAPERVAADGEGNVYAAGTLNAVVDFGGGSRPVTGNFDAFVVSLRPDGQLRWVSSFPGVDTDRALGLAVDLRGRVLVTGFISRAVDFGGGALRSAGSYDIFVASFTGAGAHRWSRLFGTAAYEESRAVAADEHGGVLVAGTFRAALDLGGTTVTPAGSDDAFVGRFLPE